MKTYNGFKHTSKEYITDDEFEEIDEALPNIIYKYVTDEDADNLWMRPDTKNRYDEICNNFVDLIGYLRYLKD